MNTSDLIFALLDDGYSHKTWHGPNLRQSLKGVSASEAAWRPAPGRHNIWELALHAAYWKYAVRRQLTGEERATFGEEGSNFFLRPAANLSAAAREKSWRKDLEKLNREHQALLKVVKQFKESQLDQK